MLLDLWPAARRHEPYPGADPGTDLPPAADSHGRARFHIDLDWTATPVRSQHTINDLLTLSVALHATTDHDLPVHLPLLVANDGQPRHTPASRRWLALDDEETLLALLARIP